MKILLVQPGQKLAFQGNNPNVIEKERGKNPPLGLLYVASTIEQIGRHRVTVIDLNLPGMELAEFKNYLKQENFDVLGITVTTFTLLDALEVIAAFRECSPGGKVIAGGPHVAIYPHETVGLGVVDVAVKREGEPVINEILDRLGDPLALAEVPGICYRQVNGDIFDTGEALCIDQLDSLPPPNRALLPYQRLLFSPGKRCLFYHLVYQPGVPIQLCFL